MKTAISYSRVSKEDDSQSYERQQVDIINYCAKNDFKLIAEFAEKKSGLKKTRKGLTEMLNYCKENKPSALIVSEISRLGRTNAVILTIEQLKEWNINFISLKENLILFNPDYSINASAMLMINILTGIANFEVSSLDYRVKSALRNNVRKGKSTGYNSLPFGYTTDSENNIIIDEDKAEIISNIFEMYKNGTGVYTITNYLNQNNILNRRNKEFNQFNVHFMLKNPMYKGYRRFNNELHYFPELTIVDAETFDYCQNLRVNKDNYQHINNKYDYLLNDVLTCGCCGNKFVGVKTTGKKGNNYYTCKLNRLRKGCENQGINIDNIDEFVTNQVLVYFSEEIFKNQDFSNIDNEIQATEGLYYSTNSALKSIAKQQSKLLDLYLSDSISKDVLDLKIAEVEKDKARFQTELNGFNSKLADLRHLKALQADRQNIAKEIRKNGLKKELLNKIVDKVLITPSNESLTGRANGKSFRVDIVSGDFSTSYLIAQRANISVELGTSKNPRTEEEIQAAIKANKQVIYANWKRNKRKGIKQIQKGFVGVDENKDAKTTID